MMKLTLKFSRNCGFTLVELVMTIMVVSIVAIPISLMISSHFTGLAQSSAHTSAINLARFEMEKVSNMDYAGVISTNINNYEGYGFDITRTVTFVQGNAVSAESLKRIQVDVKNNGSATVLFSLISYRARNVTYGT